MIHPTPMIAPPRDPKQVARAGALLRLNAAIQLLRDAAIPPKQKADDDGTEAPKVASGER